MGHVLKYLVVLTALMVMGIGQRAAVAEDAAVSNAVTASPPAAGTDQVIGAGKAVTFDYTLSTEGKVVESSDGKEPIKYTDGDGAIIPGLEKALQGMKVGEEKTVVLSAQDGYGDIDPKAVQEVPKTMIAPDVQLTPGLILQMNDESGNVFPAVVKEVKADTVLLDFNHPLAGKELTFKVKIADIK